MQNVCIINDVDCAIQFGLFGAALRQDVAPVRTSGLILHQKNTMDLHFILDVNAFYTRSGVFDNK